MMQERDALLAAIEAAPGDDAPRLIFADWLEENGRADLAAWIRGTLSGPHELHECGETDKGGVTIGGNGKPAEAWRMFCVTWPSGHNDPGIPAAAAAEVMRSVSYSHYGLLIHNVSVEQVAPGSPHTHVEVGYKRW